MRKFFKELVTDKNGKVVIFQSPNLPIIGWFTCLVVAQIAQVANVGFLKTGFMSLSGAFLFLWSYQEITNGDSYIRRLAGVIVLSFVIIAFFI